MTALLVIDLQRGFDDPYWGQRNNPRCEENVAALVGRWTTAGEPVVFVRHDSVLPESPLRPGQAGNELKPVLAREPDLLVTKRVNSAFIGDPGLDDWLRAHGISSLAVTGIQTNFCCETTARHGANLGYEVDFVIDATHTFDRELPDGTTISADEFARITAANLDPEFCRVVRAADLLP